MESMRMQLEVLLKYGRGIGPQKLATGILITGLVLCNVILVVKLQEQQGDSNAEVSRHERGTDDDDDYTHYSYSAGGAMFTRWGRTVCPEEDQLVYPGVVGGALFTHIGSGANYICLPMDPIFGKITPGVQNPGIVYGAEYETGANSFGSFSNQNAEAIHDHNVPCAVCRSSSHTSTVMIPARDQCYEGWHAEYDGFLMSAHHTHKGKTEFVCVDHDPEAEPSGYTDENGVLFYHVESACGSLPCPPYDNGKELTCVVCTK